MAQEINAAWFHEAQSKSANKTKECIERRNEQRAQKADNSGKNAGFENSSAKIETQFSNLSSNKKVLLEGDVSELARIKPIIHADALTLFSATQRSNGGRSRFRHTGQTSSIYLSDKVAEEKGKYQIGTLSHTIAIKKGGLLLTSVSELKQKEIQPLFDFLPEHTPTFTDDGYPWMMRYNKNHRAINHSARAKDKKRNKWARNRWSKDGVNNQVAEGNQRMIKHAFLAAYSYFTPEYSPLYLNEYSVLKSLKVYGLNRLLQPANSEFVAIVDHRFF